MFTTIGAFSAVCPRTDGGRGRDVDPSLVMVRARLRDHLAALVARFPALAAGGGGGDEIVESPHADYRWRVVTDKAAWADALRGLAMDADYPNFKSAAAAAAEPGHAASYVAALHDVWAVMARLQAGDRPPAPPVKRRPRRGGGQ